MYVHMHLTYADMRTCAQRSVYAYIRAHCTSLYVVPTEASNPSGGYCCQTYWGLFLRQPEDGGGGGDGGRWSSGWFRGWWASKKGEGCGWLALLICKTANLRTLCLPVLLFVLSTFSTAFSSYGETTRSFSLFLSLAPSISRFDLSSFLACVSRPLQTHAHIHIPIHIVTLSLFPSPFRLSYLPSLIPAVRPVSSTYLL